MKKLFKLTPLLLLVTMAFNLIACTSYFKVKNTLENIGYDIIKNQESDAPNQAKDDERVAKVYVFTNSNSLTGLGALKPTVVTVIEFKSINELVEYYKESATIQGIVADIEKDGTAEEVYYQLKRAGLVCGNCIIIPIGLDYNNVLNAIKELNN